MESFLWEKESFTQSQNFVNEFVFLGENGTQENEKGRAVSASKQGRES